MALVEYFTHFKISFFFKNAQSSISKRKRIQSFPQILSHTVEAALSPTIPVVCKSLCCLGMLPLRPLKLEGSSNQYHGMETRYLSPNWQRNSILYSERWKLEEENVVVKGTGGICSKYVW